MPGLYGYSGNANVAVSSTPGLYINSGAAPIITNAQQLLNLLSNNGTVFFQLDPTTGYTQVEAFVGNTGGSGGNLVITLTGNVTGQGFSGYPINTTLSNTALSYYTGNITGNTITVSNGIFYSNGQPFVSSSYGNANVAAYLPIYAGNISANNYTVLGGIFYSNGQPFVTTGVSTYLPTYQGNVGTTQTGNVNTGNVYANYGTFSGNVIVSGNLSIVGNTYFSNVNTIVTTTILANATTPSTSTGTGAIVTYGGLGVAGNVFADAAYTNKGYFYANGQAYLSNADPVISSLIANAASQQTQINTSTTGLATLNANVGAYQIYANANAASQQTSINTINANVATINANVATINANLGAYQIYANANAASQQTQINSLATGANANTASYLLANTIQGNIQANIVTLGPWGNAYAGGPNSYSGILKVQGGNGAGLGYGAIYTVQPLNGHDTYGYAYANVSAIEGSAGNPQALGSLSQINLQGNILVPNTLFVGPTVSGLSTFLNYVGGTPPSLYKTYNPSAVFEGNVIYNFVNGGTNNKRVYFYSPVLVSGGGSGADILTVSGGNLNVGGASPANMYTTSFSGSSGNIYLGAGTAIYGDGSKLTGIVSTYSNTNVAAYLTTATINTTGNITAANLTTGGNVTASYVKGNGSLLTNLPTQTGTYSNANVAAYLPTYAGTIGTANISAQTLAWGYQAHNSGANSQSIAIGYEAGYENQGTTSVAIGTAAGFQNQGQYAVAIGPSSGPSSQADYSVALGYQTNPTARSVVISADNGGLSDGSVAGFYVQPVRNDNSNVINTVYYNTTTKELTYGPVSTGTYGNSNVAAYLASNTDATISNLNANAAVQAVAIALLNANVGAYETYANLTFSTVANAASQQTQIDTLNANVGAYETYANLTFSTVANAASQQTQINTNTAGLATLNANVGAFETYANVTFSTVANAASQQTQIDTNTAGLATLNANVGAFETYANLTFSTSNYSNVNVADYLTTATISTTGNITGANLITAGNVYGNYIIGNGSLLTNLPTQTGTYSNTNVAAYLTGTIAVGNISSTNGYFWANGTAYSTASAFTGNLAGSILYDSVNQRWFGNAYPLSTPNATRYQNGFSDYIQTAPTYTNGAVQPPALTGLASRGGTTVGAVRSANIAIQSAYGVGGVKQIVNTLDYMQILGVTANTMNNNDRVRGFLAQLDVNPTGYTWGTTGTGSQGATNLAAAGTITQLIGSGTVGHMIGVSGGVNVIPAPNTQANLLYGTGSFSVVTLAANATVTGQGNIGYARLFAGALAGFSSNLTVQNAVGLHTYSGWAGSGLVGAANNPILGRYAVLNEDSNTTIQTNGNIVSTGSLIQTSGNITAGNITSTNGYFWANGTPYANSNYGNTQVAAYLPTDPTIQSIQANVGTLYLGNIATNANLGAYQTYANTATQTINANLGAYQTYANTAIQTINANLDAFETYANATFATSGSTYGNANVGAYLAAGISSNIVTTGTGNQYGTMQTFNERVVALGNVSGTQTVNLSLGSVQTMTLTGNITISNSSFTNLYPGGTITIIITQDGTGGRTLTSSGIKWSGGNYSLSTAAGAIDTATIFYDGTNYLATLVKGYT